MKNPLFPNPTFYPFPEDFVIRGGYWSHSPRNLHATKRDSAPPSIRPDDVGFRLFRSQEKS